MLEKKSKLTVVFTVAAVIFIAGLAVYYVKLAPIGELKQQPIASLGQKSSSTPAVSTTTTASQSTEILSQKTGTATLTWAANMETDFAGFKIYYGAFPRTGNCPPGGYLNKIDVKQTNTPKKPSYTIIDLEKGKTYYFSLTSYDKTGNESCFSPQFSKVIGTN